MTQTYGDRLTVTQTYSDTDYGDGLRETDFKWHRPTERQIFSDRDCSDAELSTVTNYRDSLTEKDLQWHRRTVTLSTADTDYRDTDLQWHLLQGHRLIVTYGDTHYSWQWHWLQWYRLTETQTTVTLTTGTYSDTDYSNTTRAHTYRDRRIVTLTYSGRLIVTRTNRETYRDVEV